MERLELREIIQDLTNDLENLQRSGKNIEMAAITLTTKDFGESYSLQAWFKRIATFLKFLNCDIEKIVALFKMEMISEINKENKKCS